MVYKVPLLLVESRISRTSNTVRSMSGDFSLRAAVFMIMDQQQPPSNKSILHVARKQFCEYEIRLSLWFNKPICDVMIMLYYLHAELLHLWSLGPAMDDEAAEINKINGPKLNWLETPFLLIIHSFSPVSLHCGGGWMRMGSRRD